MMVKPFSEGEIRNFLRSLKLCKYETEAYLTLLKYGPQDYKGLTELSGVPYGKIYCTLNVLAIKEWVGNLDQRPRIFYALDPEKPLKNHLVRMKKQVNDFEESFQRIIPQLKALYNQPINGFH